MSIFIVDLFHHHPLQKAICDIVHFNGYRFLLLTIKWWIHQFCTTRIKHQICYIYLTYGCYIIDYKAFRHILGGTHAAHKVAKKKSPIVIENKWKFNTTLIGLLAFSISRPMWPLQKNGITNGSWRVICKPSISHWEYHKVATTLTINIDPYMRLTSNR